MARSLNCWLHQGGGWQEVLIERSGPPVQSGKILPHGVGRLCEGSDRVVDFTREDLETIHSIEEYRVSNVQYRVSSILKNCDLFCLFSPKRSYFKAKNTHFWKFNQVKYFPMELVNFVKGLTGWIITATKCFTLSRDRNRAICCEWCLLYSCMQLFLSAGYFSDSGFTTIVLS